MRGGCTVGLTMRVELKEMPVEVAAEALNTAHTFVVVLDSLQCAWACKRPDLEACSSLLGRAAGQGILVQPFCTSGKTPFELMDLSNDKAVNSSRARFTKLGFHGALGQWDHKSSLVITRVVRIEVFQCTLFFDDEGAVGDCLLLNFPKSSEKIISCHPCCCRG